MWFLSTLKKLKKCLGILQTGDNVSTLARVLKRKFYLHGKVVIYKNPLASISKCDIFALSVSYKN